MRKHVTLAAVTKAEHGRLRGINRPDPLTRAYRLAYLKPDPAWFV